MPGDIKVVVIVRPNKFVQFAENSGPYRIGIGSYIFVQESLRNLSAIGNQGIGDLSIKDVGKRI